MLILYCRGILYYHMQNGYCNVVVLLTNAKRMMIRLKSYVIVI